MSGETKRTTDHDTIRQWAEERDGAPATVEDTMSDGEPGVLRFNFPGYSGEDSLKEISWEAFFDKFEDADLAMLYQDKMRSGETSRFFKFVSREDDE